MRWIVLGIWICGCLGCLAQWPALARASNEDDFFVGGRAAMTGGAVVASVADGSAAYYNAAGLASVHGTRLDVSANAFGLRIAAARGFIRVQGGPVRDASIVEVVAVPTQVAFVRALSQDVTLALAYFVPRASDLLLSERLELSDGPNAGSVWSLDARLSAHSYWLVAALGVRLGERLRVGVGAFGVYDDLVQSTAFSGSTLQGGRRLQALEVSSLGTESRLSAALGVGLQFDVSRRLTLGAWLRGPRLQVLVDRSESDNLLSVDASMEPPALEVFSQELGDTAAPLQWVSLGRYHLAAAYRMGFTRLNLEADVQPGFRNLRAGIDRVWTLNLRAGVMHEVEQDVVLGCGLFSDRHTQADRSHSDFYGVTAGVEFTDVLGLARGERAEQLRLGSVLALRYAYGRGLNATLVVKPDEGAAGLAGAGQGPQRTHEVTLHVGSTLAY